MEKRKPNPGPYYCFKCGEELPADAPFESDNGENVSASLSYWGYCAKCKDWTEYPPVKEES